MKRGKGNIGLCQDVTVPLFNASLTLYVWEGGNHPSVYNNDVEAEIYAPSGSFATGGTATPFTSGGLSGQTAYTSTTAVPSKILFLEENCYDTLNSTQTFDPGCSIPGSTGAAMTGASTAAANGGKWEQKGPFDLTAFAGQSVTVFIGLMGSSTSTTFYGYAYFDDVSLTGTNVSTSSVRRAPAQNYRSR